MFGGLLFDIQEGLSHFLRARGALPLVQGKHALDELIEASGNQWVVLADGREDKAIGSVERITSRQATMHGGAERVDVGTRAGLPSAMLFRRGVAWRSQQDRILQLPFFEETRDAKIDKEQSPVSAYHHIRRFEIAENDRGGLHVQEGQHITELHGIVHHLPDG